MTLVRALAGRALAPFKAEERNYSVQLTGHSGPVNECKFSPNGAVLASCAAELILWSVSNVIECVGSLRPHKFPITSVDFSCDSVYIVTASADKTVAVLDTETGKLIRKFKDHREIVNSVGFMGSPNQNLVVSGGDDCLVVINDLRQREKVCELRSNSPVTSISASGSFVCVGGVCGGVFVDELDVNRLRMKHRVECTSLVFGIAMDPTERFLAAIEESSKVTLFDIQPLALSENRTLSLLSNGDAHKEIVPPRIAFSKDGRRLAAGSTDKILRVWDVENVMDPQLTHELPGHKGSVTGVDFHSSMPLVASGSTDGTLIVTELSG